MNRIGKWVALALLVVVVAGVVREPLFWKRYSSVLGQSSQLPLSLYEPRELIQGGNDPPAPRVAPDLESLGPEALEAAGWPWR